MDENEKPHFELCKMICNVLQRLTTLDVHLYKSNGM